MSGADMTTTGSILNQKEAKTWSSPPEIGQA